MSGPPRLRSDLVIVEQSYRGEQSYVVKDTVSHKYFRFRPVEAVVMQAFDGTRGPAEVAAALREQGLPFGAAAVEGFARKLSQMGLLERSVAEKSVLLLERMRAERRRRLKRTHYQGSLLRMRWSVPDPDRFFDRWMPRVRFCFTPVFLAVSVLLFVAYGAICATHWAQIRASLVALYTPSTYTLRTFALFWVTSLTIISIHELGHGFTCKHFGGQVHEMGAMLIYFEPAFFCNVNDAWTFPDLAPRLWVTAAGSWIQLVMAALCALIWWAATPGTVVAQIGMFGILVGGFTTIVANANPLIPLDGYYALSDYLAVPNLRQRSFAYLGWLVKRYALGLQLPAPQASDRERRILTVYGALAFVYSTTLLVLVAAWAFGKVSRGLGAIGVLAFALLMWSMLRARLRELARALATSVREHRVVWRTSRNLRWAAGGLAVALLLGLLVPWPLTVGGRFVVGPVARAAVVAPEVGAVERVYATEGKAVSAGAPVVQLRSFDLEREALSYSRFADSLANRAAVARAAGRTADAERLAAAQAEQAALLAETRARLASLQLRATVAGVIVTPRLEESVGAWVDTGQVIVTIADPDTLEVLVALDRTGATLVRAGQAVRLISFADPASPVRATVQAVSAAARGLGGASDSGLVEARARLAAWPAAWRIGVTGEAKIAVGQSSLLGALWWALRARVRTDFLL